MVDGNPHTEVSIPFQLGKLVNETRRKKGLLKRCRFVPPSAAQTNSNPSPSRLMPVTRVARAPKPSHNGESSFSAFVQEIRGGPPLPAPRAGREIASERRLRLTALSSQEQGFPVGTFPGMSAALSPAGPAADYQNNQTSSRTLSSPRHIGPRSAWNP